MGPPAPNIGGIGGIIPGVGSRGRGGREAGPTVDSAEDIPGRLDRPGSGGRDSGPEGLTNEKRVLETVLTNQRTVLTWPGLGWQRQEENRGLGRSRGR